MLLMNHSTFDLPFLPLINFLLFPLLYLNGAILKLSLHSILTLSKALAMAAIFTSFTLLLVLLFPTKVAQAVGFTTDLIHRDSPQSPFYNPNASRTDRLRAALLRSFSRAAHLEQSFSQSPNSFQSQIVPTRGEFLMKLSIGTPPREFLLIADTGSDVTWTQCEPCTQCYKQSSPLFDPKKSSTYNELSCQSQTCKDVDQFECGDQNTCKYSFFYGDQSYTNGNIASETFMLGSNTIPNIVFGCGHENGGTYTETEMGVVGLSSDSLSLVGQLGKSIHGKFSYCLVGTDNDANITSKISFGDNAVVSGSGVFSTPLVKTVVPTLYFITLESIKVGNKRFLTNRKFEFDPPAGKGNMVIDSGTTFTYVPNELYGDLESELKRVIKAQPTPDPEGEFSLCYRNNISIIDLPNITFMFKGGELVLPPMNTFFQKNEVVCLGMGPAGLVPILGNLCQMNFLIGFDLVKRQVSFMPTDCSKH